MDEAVVATGGATRAMFKVNRKLTRGVWSTV